MEQDSGSKIRVLMLPAEGIAPTDQFTPNTMARLQTARQLVMREDFDLIVFSGGKFLDPWIQTKPAAILMRDWFFSIPCSLTRERGIVEIRSLDSYQNVHFTVDKLNRFRIKAGLDWSQLDITVCTEYFHARRIATTFRLCYGIDVKIHGVKQPDMGVMAYVKEFFLNVLHFLDPHGNSYIPRKNREARREAARRKGEDVRR